MAFEIVEPGDKPGEYWIADDQHVDAAGDDEVELVRFPLRFQLCPTCDGRGKHSHAVDGNGLTSEDFDQDPDFAESYMRGDYDRECETCKGLRVVEFVDDARIPERYRDAWAARQVAERQLAAELATERRMRSYGGEW